MASEDFSFPVPEDDEEEALKYVLAREIEQCESGDGRMSLVSPRRTRRHHDHRKNIGAQLEEDFLVCAPKTCAGRREPLFLALQVALELRYLAGRHFLPASRRRAWKSAESEVEGESSPTSRDSVGIGKMSREREEDHQEYHLPLKIMESLDGVDHWKLFGQLRANFTLDHGNGVRALVTAETVDGDLHVITEKQHLERNVLSRFCVTPKEKLIVDARYFHKDSGGGLKVQEEHQEKASQEHRTPKTAPTIRPYRGQRLHLRAATRVKFEKEGPQHKSGSFPTSARLTAETSVTKSFSKIDHARKRLVETTTGRQAQLDSDSEYRTDTTGGNIRSAKMNMKRLTIGKGLSFLLQAELNKERNATSWWHNDIPHGRGFARSVGYNNMNEQSFLDEWEVDAARRKIQIHLPTRSGHERVNEQDGERMREGDPHPENAIRTGEKPKAEFAQKRRRSTYVPKPERREKWFAILNVNDLLGSSYGKIFTKKRMVDIFPEDANANTPDAQGWKKVADYWFWKRNFHAFNLMDDLVAKHTDGRGRLDRVLGIPNDAVNSPLEPWLEEELTQKWKVEIRRDFALRKDILHQYHDSTFFVHSVTTTQVNPVTTTSDQLRMMYLFRLAQEYTAGVLYLDTEYHILQPLRLFQYMAYLQKQNNFVSVLPEGPLHTSCIAMSHVTWRAERALQESWNRIPVRLFKGAEELFPDTFDYARHDLQGSRAAWRAIERWEADEEEAIFAKPRKWGRDYVRSNVFGLDKAFGNPDAFENCMPDKMKRYIEKGNSDRAANCRVWSRDVEMEAVRTASSSVLKNASDPTAHVRLIAKDVRFRYGDKRGVVVHRIPANKTTPYFEDQILNLEILEDQGKSAEENKKWETFELARVKDTSGEWFVPEKDNSEPPSDAIRDRVAQQWKRFIHKKDIDRRTRRRRQGDDLQSSKVDNMEVQPSKVQPPRRNDTSLLPPVFVLSDYKRTSAAANGERYIQGEAFGGEKFFVRLGYTSHDVPRNKFAFSEPRFLWYGGDNFYGLFSAVSQGLTMYIVSHVLANWKNRRERFIEFFDEPGGADEDREEYSKSKVRASTSRFVASSDPSTSSSDYTEDGSPSDHSDDFSLQVRTLSMCRYGYMVQMEEPSLFRCDSDLGPPVLVHKADVALQRYLQYWAANQKCDFNVSSDESQECSSESQKYQSE